MAIYDTIAAVIHLVFAGLWTGSVMYFVLAALPLAENGDIDAEPMSALTDRLTSITRASTVLLLLTGGHIAAQRYTVETLTGGSNGHLVLAMVGLWLLLTVLVEVGARRLRHGFDQQKVRQPARGARWLFLVAGIVALGLLIVAGMLMS